MCGAAPLVGDVHLGNSKNTSRSLRLVWVTMAMQLRQQG